jgi:endonuclease/exonuclease/phosphatase family metal-dependent hydrolase
MRLKLISLILIFSLVPLPGFAAQDFNGRYVRYQEPDFLTFEELKTLVDHPAPTGPLRNKLEKFWTSPIISNEAFYAGERPRNISHPKLGRVLNVSSWNIEKSFHMPRVIEMLTSETAFKTMIDYEKVNQGSNKYKMLGRQRARLLASDVILLQEMDIGLQRSGYLNAAGELAKALKMNYTYGAEQLEIDPVLLGIEKAYDVDGNEIKTHEFDVDPLRYKGAFGVAVLSKYPIKNVELFQLKNQGYDWYEGEKPKVSAIEKTRRLGTKLLFRNELTREMKVGGRNFFRVDLEVPDLPDRTLTIINIHLEIKCLPLAREAQMREILSYIRKIKNPVIVMGDFNAAGTDISPTSATRVASRLAKNPSTWVNAAITFLTPYGPINLARNTTNITRGLQNPLARHIPLVGPNPVYPMFHMIRSFRFDDGSSFDFRGDSERSINGKSQQLANSNQRDFKGFKTTFQVRRPIAGILGKLRLDWCFVKSNYMDFPLDDEAPYKFAPHYGETLEELNMSLKEPLSDHHPSVVSLPFEEPKLPQSTDEEDPEE